MILHLRTPKVLFSLRCVRRVPLRYAVSVSFPLILHPSGFQVLGPDVRSAHECGIQEWISHGDTKTRRCMGREKGVNSNRGYTLTDT